MRHLGKRSPPLWATRGTTAPLHSGAREGRFLLPLLAWLLLTLAPATHAEREILFYRNPMNPAITSPTPAKDEMGMDYLPVYKDEAEGTAEQGYPSVTIRPEVVNNLGVRSEPVTRGELSRRIDAVGYVELDESRLSHVHLRASGWVEDLRVRALGESVKAGDLLFRVYSPELVNAQQEFLQSLAAGEGSLTRASEERLKALGIPEGTIREVRESRRAQQMVPVFSRHGGIVSQINIREGMYVEPQMEILTLADFATVWLIVDVFERQARWVEPGQRAEVRLPGKVLEGRVEYLYPTLDARTRTLRVRLRFANPGGELRPNMYAGATLYADPRRDALSVPRSALIRTGSEARVVVALGEGRFKPVAVEPGLESGDRVEILSGLTGNEQVVVSAQFLLDSESNLKASLRRMTAPAEVAPAAAQPSGVAGSFRGRGVVNRVDPAERTVNISHEPMPELGWPGMTMDFRVTPEVKLQGLGKGAAVEFEIRALDPVTYELTAIEVVKPAAPPAAGGHEGHGGHR